MLDHFTKEQLETVQEFLLQNAHDAGLAYTEFYHRKCAKCTRCSEECFNGPDIVAAHPCPLCGEKLHTDSGGNFTGCDNAKCIKIREHYGISLVKSKYGGHLYRKDISDKKYSKNRSLAAAFFKENYGLDRARFYSLELIDLELGMLLGFKETVKDTIKQLREVVNGPDRARNTRNTEHGERSAVGEVNP